uniref:Uncharacterized protein n=1 Tax=Candidatus Methanophaga sp. ANME-1 ERB7 TaxID=2759913 RepID=A0A7G9Z4B9_9EURY|nr:hypothetical protein MNNOGLJF_00017 [Methanosarcinales archaeon ANME-1 ERB7]
MVSTNLKVYYQDYQDLKNLLERYQTVLVLSLLVALFVGLKMISTISDFKLFFANYIHWIVFLPLSFLYILTHFVNENKDRNISFLSCFLIFSYFFSFVFLLGIYSGIAGFYDIFWVIRFINYSFLEIVMFGMLFLFSILKTNNWINLILNQKKFVLFVLLFLIIIGNLFITSYSFDKAGDKIPPGYATDPMMSGEKYIIETISPKYVAGLPPFIYEGFDYRRKLDMVSFEELHYYGKALPDLIHNLSTGKNIDKNYIVYVDVERIMKYGGKQVGMDISKITESELKRIENNPTLNKIYSNDEVDIYDSYKRDD